MFTDPLVLPLAGTNINLARISIAPSGTIYQNADRSITVTISQQTTGKNRVRWTFRLDIKAVVSNPLDSTNDYDTNTVYIVNDRPQFGFSEADIEHHVTAVTAMMTSAYIAKLHGGES
jgi:hypothetical protein